MSMHEAPACSLATETRVMRNDQSCRGRSPTAPTCRSTATSKRDVLVAECLSCWLAQASRKWRSRTGWTGTPFPAAHPARAMAVARDPADRMDRAVHSVEMSAVTLGVLVLGGVVHGSYVTGHRAVARGA
jgi:hypothetical protein